LLVRKVSTDLYSASHYKITSNALITLVAAKENCFQLSYTSPARLKNNDSRLSTELRTSFVGQWSKKAGGWHERAVTTKQTFRLDRVIAIVWRRKRSELTVRHYAHCKTVVFTQWWVCCHLRYYWHHVLHST